MYCITTKKKPNIARKNTVMPAAPVANVGTGEQSDVEQGMAAAQFDDAERDRQRPARRPMHPSTSGSVQPRSGASRMPNTRTATAPPMSTAPSQSSGLRLGFLGRRDRQRQREQHRTRAGERPEDGLPRPEVQQPTGAEHADDGAGAGGARPDANGLVALVLWIGRGEQRQRRGHDEGGACTGDAAGDDEVQRVRPDDGGDATRRRRRRARRAARPAVRSGRRARPRAAAGRPAPACSCRRSRSARSGWPRSPSRCRAARCSARPSRR